jgi:hypothetical protein
VGILRNRFKTFKMTRNGFPGVFITMKIINKIIVMGPVGDGPSWDGPCWGWALLGIYPVGD